MQKIGYSVSFQSFPPAVTQPHLSIGRQKNSLSNLDNGYQLCFYIGLPRKLLKYTNVWRPSQIISNRIQGKDRKSIPQVVQMCILELEPLLSFPILLFCLSFFMCKIGSTLLSLNNTHPFSPILSQKCVFQRTSYNICK